MCDFVGFSPDAADQVELKKLYGLSRRYLG